MTDTTVEAPATPRLKQKYNEQIVPELEKEFHYSNPMQVARVQKVVVSMGVGAAARDSKLIEGAVKDLTLITGQKPKITKAKKSVAQFHLREGQAIGAYVTLRGERMWEFLDRLLTMALPRIRDFRGINGNQFDGQGNYNFGLTEQSMFHEIDPDSIDHQRGMDITVVTSTKDDKEARVLLKHLGFPFKENDMAKTALKNKAPLSRSSRCALIRVARSAVVLTPSTASSAFAASAFVRRPTAASCPALRIQLVNNDAEGPRPNRSWSVRAAETTARKGNKPK